jgi:hypothetical protein
MAPMGLQLVELDPHAKSVRQSVARAPRSGAYGVTRGRIADDSMSLRRSRVARSCFLVRPLGIPNCVTVPQDPTPIEPEPEPHPPSPVPEPEPMLR